MSEEIPGLDALKANFDALSYGLQRKILMTATRKGALVIVTAMQARAPRLQLSTTQREAGALAAGILSRIWDSSTSEVTARIGPDKKTFYGRFPEFGTVHEAAEPFVRPALDEKRDEALAVIGQELWSGIQKVELQR